MRIQYINIHQPKGIHMFDILFDLFSNTLDLVGAVFGTSSFGGGAA